MRPVHDSDLNWEVSLKWEPGSKYVTATDVPITELVTEVLRLALMTPPFGGRQGAWQITRMDEVNYRASRVMARKGKRRHPTERAWQQALAGLKREERLANAGQKQRDRNAEIDVHISDYMRKHEED